MDITNIICIIISLAVAVLVGMVFPLIRTRVGAERWDMICQYALAGVQAAEIIIGAGNGAEKFEWAKEYIQNQCEQHGIKIDMDTVQVAIENAWKQLGLDEKASVKTAGF